MLPRAQCMQGRPSSAAPWSAHLVDAARYQLMKTASCGKTLPAEPLQFVYFFLTATSAAGYESSQVHGACCLLALVVGVWRPCWMPRGTAVLCWASARVHAVLKLVCQRPSHPSGLMDIVKWACLVREDPSRTSIAKIYAEHCLSTCKHLLSNMRWSRLALLLEWVKAQVCVRDLPHLGVS